MSEEIYSGADPQELDEIAEEIERRRLYFSQKNAPTQQHHVAHTVKFRQGVGKFIIPKENTWAAHRILIVDPKLKLGYSAEHYPYFDSVINDYVSFSPLTNAGDVRYSAYDVLRENLAIVRNYIMGEFFPDGSIDKDDEAKLRHLVQVGEFIGKGLNNDRLFFNPIKPRVSKEKANMPGTGAQYIYEQILKRQTYHNWLMPIMLPIQKIKGQTPKHWNLPDLIDSPFSDENLMQPPPKTAASMTSDEIAVACSQIDRDSTMSFDAAHTYADGINHIADDLTHASTMYNGVDTLQEPTRRESVEIAKEILRKLKVKLGAALIENGLTPKAASNFSILESIKGVVQVYEFHLNKLLQLAPDAMNNPTITHANDAIGKMGYVAKVEALRVAEKGNDTALAKSLYNQIMQMPTHWQHPTETHFGQLFEQIEDGLNSVIARLEQLEEPDASVENWMGRQNYQAIGTIDPQFEGKDKKNQNAMADDDYYRRYNANRQAQQAIRYKSAQKAQEQGGTVNSTVSNAPKKSSMDTLIASKDVAAMRDQMHTDSGAMPVKSSEQARRQAIIKDQAKREAQRQQQRMRTVEMINRANKRQDDDLQSPTSTPAMKKKNSSMTI